MVPRWILHVAAVFAPRIRSNLAVDKGDSLRDQQDWVEAAQCYRRALAICPDRQPIWIQLGHVLKETGQPEEALSAYRHACALPGNDGDAQLRMGIMAKQTGQFAEAKAALRWACQLMPENAFAQTEFLQLLHDPLAVEDRTRLVANALSSAESVRLSTAVHEGRMSLMFDASDLVSYFRHSRLPTGIQRVQMEGIRAALDMQAGVQVGCFNELSGHWTRIPAEQFKKLCTLSVANGDRMDAAWVAAIEILTAILSENVPVTFAKGGFLVNLGSSWWLQNYFLHVRRVQRAFGIHYVPFVHDFIPAIAPEHCVKELTQDFLSWALHVFDHAEYFLVNSRSTMNDLHRVAHLLGHDVPASHVAVVPLDADFRRPTLVAASDDQLTQWGLANGGFVLFVSTVESRKNHLIAFHAWREMIARHGTDRVPDLVCVGNRGWLNDHVYAALDADPVLAAKVHMLSHLADEQLALLYRSCLFTVYPSSYEGWGLPVTESLCYGKVPVLCRSSSLPEAGGDFAVYFDPDDLPGLVAAIERLTLDAAARDVLEQRIRTDFVPRTWQEVAQQIVDDLGRFGRFAGVVPKAVRIPPIVFDCLYRLARNRQTKLTTGVNDGENLRSGSGWWAPEDSDCATRPEGGEIAFALPEEIKTVRCWLRLRGPLGRQSGVTVESIDRTLRFDLPEGGWRWVSFLAEADRGQVRFVVQGHNLVDLSAETLLRDRRTIGAGLGAIVVSACVEARSSHALAQRMAHVECDNLAFLRDAFMLLLNREIDDHDLPEYLPGLEANSITRAELTDILARTLEYSTTTQQTIVFD